MNSLLFPARDCTAPTAPAVLASASRAWGGRSEPGCREGVGELGCGGEEEELVCQEYLLAGAPLAPRCPGRRFSSCSRLALTSSSALAMFTRGPAGQN